jgi:PAS domain S-box-containing protein
MKDAFSHKNRLQYRERLENALREVSHYRKAIDSHNLVSITDREGRIIFTNEKFCKVSGYSAEELLGKTHTVINSGLHSKAFFQNLWQTIGSGNIWQGEIRNRAKNGTYYWVDNTIIPVKNDQDCVIKYLSIRTDVTQRKAQEERLRIHSQALENASDGILILDALQIGFPIIFCNPAFRNMSGFSCDEIQNKSIELFQGENTHPHVWTMLQHRLENKLPFEDELMQYKKNRSPFWNHIRITPVIDESGLVTHFVVMNRDITEEKLDQLKKELALEQLENQNRAGENQINAMTQTIEENIKEREHVSLALKQAHRDLTDSLAYAGRIQQALLPKHHTFKIIFPESFIFSLAKDIVNGDFLWFNHSQDTKVIVLADCTGHGVPGALISLMTSNMLDKIVVEFGVTKPGLIAEHLQRHFQQVMAYGNDQTHLNDGLDIGIITINERSNKIQFTGASRSLYISNPINGIREIKGDSHTIAMQQDQTKMCYNTHEIALTADDTVYITTDGFYSQFSEHTSKKFMRSRFNELLDSIAPCRLDQQEEIIRSSFLSWKGSAELTDDVFVVGLKPLTPRYF